MAERDRDTERDAERLRETETHREGDKDGEIQREKQRQRPFLKDLSGFLEQYFTCFQNPFLCLQIHEMPFITLVKYLKQKQQRKPEDFGLQFSGISPHRHTP